MSVSSSPVIEYITSRERLGYIAQEIENSPIIGLDIETTHFEPYAIDKRGLPAAVRLLSINTGKVNYVIDLFQTGEPDPILAALSEQNTILAIQNAKFEQKWFLYKYNLELWPIFDTYRASAIIYNGLDYSHDLWSVQERELGIPPGLEDLGGSDWSKPNLSSEQIQYAAEDVVHIIALRDVLKEKLKVNGLLRVALIEFGAVLPEATTEISGIYLDERRWVDLAEANRKKAKDIRDTLIWKLPNPDDQLGLPGVTPGINLDSPLQILGALKQLGGSLAELEDTREMTLAMCAAEHPIVEEILSYREFAKKVSQFGPKYLKYVDPFTGRIHTSYFPFTGAGRYASSSPNLQQIPRTSDFRSCFRAQEGYRIVAADYSNIEMRVCAELSNDAKLLALFNSKDDDAHRATAAMLAEIARAEVTKKQRQEAKSVNFGLLYGMGAAKLVLYAMANYNVIMSLARATEVRDKFFSDAGYIGIKKWHQYSLEHFAPKRMVTTLTGRVRYFKDDVYSEYFNTQAQGSAADGLKAALRDVYFQVKKRFGSCTTTAKIIHHVHDEILLEVPDDPDAEKEAREALCEGMTEGMCKVLKKVPVKVEPESGPSWGEAKS